MKKLISRVCCLCCVVLVLAACLPLSAFAVDPVSAGVMANAFAQAIAAYGASNGVAMTFDVTSTDGIGESVHELWKDFREGTQDADDYATLAAALFPDLYYKAATVVGGVSDVYTVGYNISSTYAEEFDNFFDWLLSGPAEMVKVDNAYYQFASAQIGPNAQSISVSAFSPWDNQPIPYISGSSSTAAYIREYGYLLYSALNVTPGLDTVCVLGRNGSTPIYAFSCFDNDGATTRFYCCSPSSDLTVVVTQAANNNTTNRNISQYDSSSSLYYFSVTSQTTASVASNYTPFYASLSDGLNAISGFVSSGFPSDNLGVKASTNTGVAQFPDTTDPNYEAVGKQIPSTVPWDNTAYGDGTGTLTDAQAGAIAAGADTAIARDGVLDLAGTDEATDEPGVDDPPTTDPDDYAVPGLAEIFPFCIPFDIYNFLSALAAQPVAPHFTATLDFPEAVGGTQTIDIDFDSPTWNQLAQLLRLLELLAFIIGLALLTRSMFIRG